MAEFHSTSWSSHIAEHHCGSQHIAPHFYGLQYVTNPETFFFFFLLRSDVYELDQRFHLSEGFNTARERLFHPSYFKIEDCSLGAVGAFLNANHLLCTLAGTDLGPDTHVGKAMP